MTTAGVEPTTAKNGEAKQLLTPEQAAQAAQAASLATPGLKRETAKDDPNINGTISAFGSGGNFETAQRIATALAKSSMVPKAYQNSIPNCLVALELSNRIGASVLAVMQHMVPIHGKPTWDSTFLIATVNASKKFSSLRFKFVGTRGQDDWGCYAYARDLSDGDVLEGTTITIGMAKAEGWYDRKSSDGGAASKWPTMPQQMLMYRAAAFWTRVYCPELSMGMQTTDEVDDSGPLPPIDAGAGLSAIPGSDAANTGRRMSLGGNKPVAPTQPASVATAPISVTPVEPANETAPPVDAEVIPAGTQTELPTAGQ